MESYLSRWARVAGVVRSFTATNSISGFPRAVRKTLRPMRPKPLIPTFTAISPIAPVVLSFILIVNAEYKQEGKGGGGAGGGALICEGVLGCVTSVVCANCANGCAKKEDDALDGDRMGLSPPGKAGKS